jgi:Tol biopolymer transport system component
MRFTKKALVLVCAVLLALALAPTVFISTPEAYAGEAPLLEWDPPKTFDVSENDGACCVRQTSDGGYILGGWAYPGGYIGGHLFKTYANGDLEWERSFAWGSGIIWQIQETSDGGYVLAGSLNALYDDAFIAKVDSNGNHLWKEVYGGPYYSDAFYSLVETADGGYLLAGYKGISDGGDGRNAWLVKTDSSGKLVWEKDYGESGSSDMAFSVCESDDGYMLAGQTVSYGSGGWDGWLLKVDAYGNEVWSEPRTYGGPNHDGFRSINKTSDGGYILVGYTSSSGAGDMDAWLIKTDAEGNEVWDEPFVYRGTGDDDSSFGVQEASDGGYVFACNCYFLDNQSSDVTIVKTDAEGVIDWELPLEGDGKYFIYDIQSTADGGYICAGYTSSYGYGGNDAWLVKLGGQHNQGDGDILRCSESSEGIEGDSISSWASINDDGRYVAFSSSASNLVLGDNNNQGDVFRKDLLTGEVLRCSTTPLGAEGNLGSEYPAISADGRYVAFESNATNLVPDDTNSQKDIFRKDIETGDIIRCSTSTTGEEGNGEAFGPPSISDDGKYVVFSSSSSNLVFDDTNGEVDIFRKDCETDEIVICSTAASNAQSNDWSGFPDVSADGRYVAFSSVAYNLVPDDTNYSIQDIFRKDLLTGEIALCSISASGEQGSGSGPSISPDGRFVVFNSDSSDLVPGDTNDVADIFRKDLENGEVTRCSVTFARGEADSYSGGSSISADGRYVAFFSYATNLLGSGNDNNAQADIFRKDLLTGEIVRCSISASGEEGNERSWPGSFNAISADGKYVAFSSLATNLVPGDTNGVWDVFRKEVAITPAPPTEQPWTFAVITDIHIGCFYDDYGREGWDDGALYAQEYFLTDRLRRTVERINSSIASENIKFVAVLGDFTDSAEYSEFIKAEEILDGLEVPYVPVLGNHDIWPYTLDGDANLPYGSNIFENLFKDTIDEFKGSPFVDYWDKDDSYLTIEGESSCLMSPLQNYAFTIGGINYLILDCINRQQAPNIPFFDSHGAYGSGYLHQGTKDWLNEKLDAWGDQPVVIFSHHPFFSETNYADYIYPLLPPHISAVFESLEGVGAMHFSEDDYEDIEECLEGHRVLVNFAGHVHSAWKLLGPIGPVIWNFNQMPYPNIPIMGGNTAVRITEGVVAGSNGNEDKGVIRLARVNPDRTIDFDYISSNNAPAYNGFFDMDYHYIGEETYKLELTPHRFTQRDTLYRWNCEGQNSEWLEYDDEWGSGKGTTTVTFAHPAQSHKVTIEAAERTAIELDEDEPANMETYYQGVHKVPWRENLQEGDILLHRKSWTLFDRYLKYTHAGIYVGEGLVAEARPDWDGGVGLYPIEDWDYPKDTYVSLYRVNTTPENREAAALLAEMQTRRVPRPTYDYLLVQRDSDDQSTHWYCSELVWASYYSMGVDLACNGHIGPSKADIPVPPDDISFDDDVTCIGGHYEDYPSNSAPGITFRADCPVNLSITDPEGMVINKEIRGIEDAAYLELDIDNDGDIEDVVDILERELGNYEVVVVPESGASAEDIYSIEISAGDVVIYSSPETPVGEIPDIPYLINSTDEQVVLVPQITAIVPTFSAAGDEATISGLSFGDIQGTSRISFGNVQANEYVSWSDREITCKVPAGVSGPVQVTVTSGGGTSNSVDFSIKKNTALEISLPANVQYSDPSTLSATLKDEEGNILGNLPVAFNIDGAEETVTTDGVTGIATLTTSVDLQSGDYDVKASYAGDDKYMPSDAISNLHVDKEAATLSYAGAFMVTVGSLAKLSATLTEEPDGSPGDITQAGDVLFSLYDLDNVLALQVTAPVGVAGKAEITTTLPADVYTVKASLAANGYYQAPPAADAQLVVYNPAGGYATGCGFLCSGGLKTFGFCVKPSNADPWLPKGDLLFVDLSNLRKLRTVKATKFAWLVIPTGEDIAYVAGTCSLDGKAGYTFTLTVEDLGGWLSRLDTIHLVVKDGSNNIAYEVQGAISGGNIEIHRK